jgi:plasmid replication initiation protein
MFSITAEDCAEMFDISPSKAYEHLKEAAENLYGRTITKIEGKVRDHQRWVYRAKYYEGEGRIELGFSPSIAPYLTMLHKNFTSYQLKRVASLRSVHSIRIFEMLTQRRDTSKLIMKLDEFKDRLELGDKYTRFYDIQRRVINPAIKELAAKSNLEITLEIKKVRRKVSTLIFNYKEIDQIPLDLTN